MIRFYTICPNFSFHQRKNLLQTNKKVKDYEQPSFLDVLNEKKKELLKKKQ